MLWKNKLRLRFKKKKKKTLENHCSTSYLPLFLWLCITWWQMSFLEWLCVVLFLKVKAIIWSRRVLWMRDNVSPFLFVLFWTKWLKKTFFFHQQYAERNPCCFFSKCLFLKHKFSYICKKKKNQYYKWTSAGVGGSSCTQLLYSLVLWPIQ